MPVYLIYLGCLLAALAMIAGFLGAGAGASWARRDDSIAAPMCATGAALAYVLVTTLLFFLMTRNFSPMMLAGPLRALAITAGLGLAVGNALALAFGMARPMLMGAGAGLVLGILGLFIVVLGMVAQTSPMILVVPMTLIPALAGVAIGYALVRSRLPEPWELMA